MIHFVLTSNIERVTLIQPQHKGDAFKNKARGLCLNCISEQEYDLTKPVNKRDLIHALEAVNSKVDTLILSSRKKPNKAKVITKKPENR